ncbi:MAG: anthranilate synthase component I family protein [Flavobacteriales bacterium]|nr:anthranilate synthase component I family protein [Flavobacteriales bacterium]
MEHLLAFIDAQDTGMCFSGKGWKTEAETLAGFGVHQRLESTKVQDAPSFCEAHADFIFCHITYDVKNQLEALTSRNEDHVGFPVFDFFVPQIVVNVQPDEVHLLYRAEAHSPTAVRALFESIRTFQLRSKNESKQGLAFHRMDEERYHSDLRTLKQHIQRGNIYQGNYCQEFHWEKVVLDPARFYQYGFDRMPNPFSVFYRTGEHALMSFSPESFLRFEGSTVTSQPMKGTSPRHADPIVDEGNRKALETSEKDRRENVMIVDLVRNDLSHFAIPGSVQVPELYTIETYPKVHQMHSTVTAQIRPKIHPIHVLLKAFPMGSMTGAPKISAMQILDRLEHSRRGIYSGSVGFFTPEGNGHFNVVIRSLVYNASTGYLSCHAGGGITDLSDPHEEYEESLVKARPIFDLVDAHFAKNSSELPLADEAAAP